MARIANNKKQQPNQKKMSKAKETRAKRLAKYLFRCLKFLSSGLRAFLASHNLLGGKKSLNQDSQRYLYIILNKRNSPNFLYKNGNSNISVNKIIKEAIKGRNKVSHNDLPEILSNWESFLNAWIDTAILIGATQVSIKIKRTLRFLRKVRKVPIRPASKVNALNVFRKLEFKQQTIKWTKSKEEASIYIADKMYDLIMEEYSPRLDEFLSLNNIQAPTSVIDCYTQTNLIFDKCTPAHFRAPNDGTPFDMAHLQTAVDGRHATVHEQNENTLLHWDSYLSSQIYVCKGIGANQSAIRIAKVRSELIAARARAKQQLKLTRMRVQSNFSIKRNKIRTNTRCHLKRLNVNKFLKALTGRRNKWKIDLK